MDMRGRIPPSVPSGHLPHKGGDRVVPQSPNSSAWLGADGLLLRPIPPLVGEMSAALTEGGISPHPLNFMDTLHAR